MSYIKGLKCRECHRIYPTEAIYVCEFLPIDKEPPVGFHSGFTPLFKADNLARILGMKELYIKDDSVCHPTLSFKDRVVAVALTRAKELGFKTVACASTGNL